MFKPNGNQDRKNYSDILMPPEGFRLEKAVGTTYSLDLEALTATAVVLGLAGETDSKIMQNPICMLHALQKISDKIILFCEDGQIKMPSKPTTLSILLEKMIVPVALPKDKKLNRYPAFHPKTWVLCYVNEEGIHKYRFAVLSRNLTFDRSWDVSFAMDSSVQVRQKSKTKPIIDFLGYLCSQVHNTSPNASMKRSMIRAFQKELANVSFSLDSKEFGENFQILPMGIGTGGYDMNKDVLFCDDRNRADYTFHELVVMSPFLTGSVIEQFNKADRGLGGCKRTLITRQSELGKMKENQVDNFDIFVLKDEIIDGENILSDEDIDKCQQDIHAKIYLRKKYSDVDLYIGSMNASYAAINKNVEMMVWLGTKNRYLNAESFLNEIFCGPWDADTNPFKKVHVVKETKDVGQEIQNKLELIIKDFCRVRKKAVITPNEDRYNVSITMEGQLRDERVYISPFCSNKKQVIDEQVIFEKLDLTQLSEFYEVCVTLEDTTVSRVIMIPTTGFPVERENAVVNSVVKDRRSFVEYIAFVLGDDYILSLLENRQLIAGGKNHATPQTMPALYEKMLKTSLDAPDRMKDIGYILKMVTDKEIVPDEFRDTYEMFCRTLKIK